MTPATNSINWSKWLGIPGIAIALALLMDGFHLDWRTVAANLAFTLVYWEGSWQIISRFCRKYNSYQETGKRIAYQVLSIVAYVFITNYLLCFILTNWINPEILFTSGLYFSTLRVSLIVSFLISTIYEAQNFFELWKEAHLETEQLKQRTLQAQFETLKNQVNPHFLFNSLNTLAAIIPENPEQAVTFVEKLSKLYRYILQYRDQDTVDLETELNNIADYLFLQKMRFGDKLTWDISVPPESLSLHVLPLSLQLLAENAVKHNIISSDKPLHFSIKQEGESLEVSNTYQPKRQTEASTGVGLQNLSERLALLHKPAISHHISNALFTVKIPLFKP
ncbi:MAG: hypothetical protein EP332_01715 [Bacteroidetes bacterium]|nr:MAG: hypothetical protein EP332_01715 [Bacteroidota bacterium]